MKLRECTELELGSCKYMILTHVDLPVHVLLYAPMYSHSTNELFECLLPLVFVVCENQTNKYSTFVSAISMVLRGLVCLPTLALRLLCRSFY